MRRTRARTQEQRVIQVNVPSERDDDEDDETPPEVAADDALVDAVRGDGIPAHPVARIYRRHPKLGGKEAFVEDVPLGTYSRAYVQETLGGGEYRVVFLGRVKGRNGRTTRGKKGADEVFTVDLTIPPKPPTSVLDLPDTSAATAGGGSGGFSRRIESALESGVLGVMQSMASVGQMQAQAVREIIEPRQRGPGLMEIIGAVTPIALAVIPHLFGREKDEIGRLAKFAEVLRGNAPGNPSGALLEHLETMERLRELGKSLAGGGGDGEGGEPSTMAVAMQGIQVLEKMMAARQANAPGNPTLPVPAPVAALPPASQPEDGGAMGLGSLALGALGRMVPQVVEWIGEGRDVEWVTEGLLHGKEAYFPALLPVLENPATITSLMSAYPVLVPHHAWLETLRQDMVAYISGGDDDSDDTMADHDPGTVDGAEPGPRRVPDAPANGATGEDASRPSGRAPRGRKVGTRGEPSA